MSDSRSPSAFAQSLAAEASPHDPDVTVNPIPVTFEVPRENPDTGQMETISIQALQRLDRAQGGMTLTEAQELAIRERSMLHGVTSGGAGRERGAELFVPGRDREAAMAPVYSDVAKGELAMAIAAGRICSACRHFDRELGQRRFQREKLGQALVRELAWKTEWWNPAEYGACHANPRDAVHEGATCESFEPKGKLVSLLGVFKRK